MIDTDKLAHITYEDFVEEFRARVAAVRDLINDMDGLVSLFASDGFITQDKAAEYFCCTPSQIPFDIPCVHRGRDYLYQMSDIRSWVKEHKKPRGKAKD